MIAAGSLARWCVDAYTMAPDIAAGIARALVRDMPAGRALIFQGTSDIEQALGDLDMGPIHAIGLGDVHEGFWRAMMGIAEKADKALGDGPAILSGHSLGGALAIALGAYRTVTGKPPRAIVTFGAPRVGIGSALEILFALYRVELQLYRHAADPVPLLPPSFEVFADWEHPAPLIQLGERGEFPEIGDHSIDRYVEALGQFISA